MRLNTKTLGLAAAASFGVTGFTGFVAAAPLTSNLGRRWVYEKFFDLQGHRGGRGHTVENTLPSFADGLINGVTTLEMDCGLTKDGHLVVWHDEFFDPLKCKDTKPVQENDPLFPYVGKYIANLTLAQIRTLDCGSLRQDGFPLQITVPGTEVSTLPEVFEFVKCATDEPVLFNIESKVDGDYRNNTRPPEDFVDAMTTFYKSLDADLVDRITHQSFDWRALILSKKIMPELRTSALCDDTTLWKPLAVGQDGNLTTHGEGPSNWLAGIDVDSFEGTIGEKVAQAAHSIKADFLSPTATSYASGEVIDPKTPGYIPFVTRDMVDKAHELGLKVKPWTPDRLNVIEYLVHNTSVDGVITDYPRDVRIWAIQHKLAVPPQSDPERVMKCLDKYNHLAI